MRHLARYIVDGAAPGLLVLALCVVFGLEGSRTPPPTPFPPPLPLPPLPQAKALELGVTPHLSQMTFDDMAKLLDSLGEGYKYHRFPLDDLVKSEWRPNYDVVFLTCSGYTEAWLDNFVGAGSRPGLQAFTANEEAFKQAIANLQAFVGGGGTLYASDLHFELMGRVFPEFIDSARVNEGKVQEMTAEVVHPGLREILGPRIDLTFDQEGWRPAAFRGEDVTVYLQGTYSTVNGGEETAPLLVKFRYKDGAVIFTSFHNEKVNSEIEVKLLRYLVFTAATARTEAEAAQRLVRGGFSPAKSDIFGVPDKDETVTYTYDSAQSGQLQFVLGFENRGAHLKLTVEGPDGRKLERDGASEFTIEVADAPAGRWRYSVSVIRVPYENFPFTVMVGTK